MGNTSGPQTGSLYTVCTCYCSTQHNTLCSSHPYFLISTLGPSTWASVALCICWSYSEKQKGSMHSVLQNNFLIPPPRENQILQLIYSYLPISLQPGMENRGGGRREKQLFSSFWRPSIKNEWSSDSVKRRLGIGMVSQAEPGRVRP